MLKIGVGDWVEIKSKSIGRSYNAIKYKYGVVCRVVDGKYLVVSVEDIDITVSEVRTKKFTKEELYYFCKDYGCDYYRRYDLEILLPEKEIFCEIDNVFDEIIDNL